MNGRKIRRYLTVLRSKMIGGSSRFPFPAARFADRERHGGTFADRVEPRRVRELSPDALFHLPPVVSQWALYLLLPTNIVA